MNEKEIVKGAELLSTSIYNHPSVYLTAEQTPFLKECGISVIGRPSFMPNIDGFINGFDKSLGFRDYLEDDWDQVTGEATKISKLGGQACYASFSKYRTHNENYSDYIKHIVDSGHGSVLEHGMYTFLIFGVSRSFTHELARHRVGIGISQISQRYVSGKVLRFVMRPEFESDTQLEQLFVKRIDRAKKEYENLANLLMEMQVKKSATILSADAKTDLRKKVQQTARAVLPNETEAFLIWSANIRALRHIFDMRGSMYAETEMRLWSSRLLNIMSTLEPAMFQDMQVEKAEDGLPYIVIQK